MIEAHKFLTEDECKRVYDSIYKLRDHWLHRDPHHDMPFYSLGAASYLDIRRLPEIAAKEGVNEEDLIEYNALVEKNNPILQSEFQWLYDRLASNFATWFDYPAKYLPNLAFPGFHIFLADWFYEVSMGVIHCDLQQMNHDWGKHVRDFLNDTDLSNMVSPEECLSFTASIKLPSNGGGLYLWDKVFDDMKDMEFHAREEYLAGIEKTYHKYSEGEIFFHGGAMYHQIAPMHEVENEDERITLQGHAVLINDVYYLYW